VAYTAFRMRCGRKYRDPEATCFRPVRDPSTVAQRAHAARVRGQAYPVGGWSPRRASLVDTRHDGKSAQNSRSIRVQVRDRGQGGRARSWPSPPTPAPLIGSRLACHVLCSSGQGRGPDPPSSCRPFRWWPGQKGGAFGNRFLAIALIPAGQLALAGNRVTRCFLPVAFRSPW